MTMRLLGQLVLAVAALLLVFGLRSLLSTLETGALRAWLRFTCRAATAAVVGSLACLVIPGATGFGRALVLVAVPFWLAMVACLGAVRDRQGADGSPGAPKDGQR